jgi:N-acetylglucosaminyldiphosphoundecaprenol N-acetyl-beta-D-mannosaminyltransferase
VTADPTSPPAVTPVPAIVPILGVPFSRVTAAEVLDRIQHMITSSRPHHIATANLDFAVQARHDVELRRILFDADLVLCDGMPLLWASRWFGDRLPERVAGSDLVPLILAQAARRGHRPFFLGGDPGTVAEAVARVQAEYAGLDVAGCYSPPFSPVLDMDHAEINARIRAARPDLLLVGLGNPKQEKWIAMNYRKLGVPVSIGVGGTIDFLAGRLPRAPVWMQRAGMEWFFRFTREPRRLFPRYARDLAQAPWPFLSQSWHMRATFRPAPARAHRELSAIMRQRRQEIELPACLDRRTVRNYEVDLESRFREAPDVLLLGSNVTTIDAAGAGFLMRQRALASRHGGGAVLVAPSTVMNRALATTRLLPFFLVATDVGEALTMLSQRQGAAASIERGDGHLAWPSEVTAANAEEVWLTTTRFIESLMGPRRAGLLDLGGVTFIDTAGLSLMIQARAVARRVGIELQFVDIRPALRNVIALAGQRELLRARPF